MSKYLPVIVTIVATVAAALALPTVVASHPLVFAALTAAAQILHAALPSIFGEGGK